MTEERANAIFSAIEAYEDAESLFKMTPEEAVAALNADGNDFSVEEIIEVGKALQTVASCAGENGEINLEELENVSGGSGYASLVGNAIACLGTWAGVAVLVACGVAIGW